MCFVYIISKGENKMERYLSNPNVDKTVVNTIQVYEGGTGGTTVKEAQEHLDILDKGAIGAPYGLAIMPPNGLFGGSFEGGVGDIPMIDGPSFVRTNQINLFFITNYDIKTDYIISTNLGRIERDKDNLIFYSGSEVGVATIRVNDLEVKLDILLAIINMPFIVSPVSGTQELNSQVDIKTSAFVTGEIGTVHSSTDWQLSTTVEMDNVFKSVEKDQTYLTYWKVVGLQENVTYYIRFRYWDNVGNKSSWSEITQFTTRRTFTPQTPTIVSPANGAKEMRADVNFTATDFFTYEQVTHVSSDWQVSSSSVFAGLIDESQADEVNLTTWSIGGLKTDTLYYVRVRYTDNLGRVSTWSLPSRFTTRKSFSADTPTITNPSNQSDNHNSTVTVASSYFSNGDSRVTHQSSDWEVSEDNSFQYPFLSSYSNSTAKVEWIAKGLLPTTTYFVRVRYRDTMGFVTDWSKPIQFSTRVSFSPVRPTITSPTNSMVDVGPWLDLRTAAYVSNNVGDEHLNSDWEIGTSLTFKDLVKWNTATIDDKISWRVKGLEEASQYFIRVRHRSIVDGVEYVSEWSPVINFTTKFSFSPGKPTITYPRSGSKDVSENITITSTNYLASDSQDVHVNSDWEIATNSAFTDIVVSNYGSAVAKTAWVVTNLRSLTTFFVRVRHRTINDGIYYVSDWSSANNFTVEHDVPAKPVVLTPSNGSTKVATNVTITSSSFLAGEAEEKHFSSSWEISTTAAFIQVVASSLNSVNNKVSWSPVGLQANTNYFVRVKHVGTLGFESEWSDASQFTTKSAAVSSTPTITSPNNGSTNVNSTITITSSSFSSSDSSDIHTSSDWELATDNGFGTKVKTSTASTVDKTTWNVTGLTSNTLYYVRVRHNGSDSGATEWSSANSFTTKAPEVVGQVAKPAITSPTNGTTGLNTSFTISASAFSSSANGDSHKATDWEVSTDVGFGTVVKSSYDNTSGKTNWSVGGLTGNVVYYLRVRYKGTIGGNSPWSDVVNVKTKEGGESGTVNKPSITSPSQGAVVSTGSVTITCSVFSSQTSGETHQRSDWEISTNSAFTVIVKSSYDVGTDLTSWGVTGLASGKTYYVRVKHSGSSGADSDWSSTISFSTSVVQVPGSNGKLKYDIPNAIFSNLGFSEGIAMSKSNELIINNVYGGGPYSGNYTNLTQLTRVGVGQVKQINYGGGQDAFGYAMDNRLDGILGSGFSKTGSRHLLHYRIQIGFGQYTQYYNKASTTDDLTGGLSTNIGGLSSLFNDSRLNNPITTFSISDDFKRIVVKQSNVGPVVVYHESIADNGKSLYSRIISITPPSEYSPVDFGSWSFISGDGNTIAVMSGFRYVYIYTFAGGGWSFKERIQVAKDINTLELSFDGSVIAIGFTTGYTAATYTKINDSWNNEKIVYAGNLGASSSTDPIQLAGHCYCCISDDGGVLSASGFKNNSRVYIYRKQPSGEWGEVGIIEETIPSNGKAIQLTTLPPVFDDLGVSYKYLEYSRAVTTPGKHRLSYDGTTCLFLSDGYIVGDTQGSFVVFPPNLFLAY